MVRQNPEKLASRLVELATEYAKKEGLGLEVQRDFQSNTADEYLIRISLFSGPSSNYEKRSELAITREGQLIQVGYEPNLGVRVYRNQVQDQFLDYLKERKALEGTEETDSSSVKVSFDPQTYSQLEKLAQDTGLSRAATTRHATRLLSWMVDRMEEGYKFALLKEGEDPRIVEFE